ncbi:putative golgin subfamily A member 6-like protein 3 [Hyperolius riggenbachi]|uniref:putative golgin subfamily A member 6-like protein 3 n=1 Tax=Hyperolius riggenbachi TaxID=752182 RepID=UPI0035A2AA34
MQDITEQRVGGFPSQKNHGRKGSGSSDENINTRKIKLQTSFPPIHLSLISNSKPLDKKLKDHASNSDLSKDTRGEKINLPQVDKASTPKPIKSFPDKSKYSKDFGGNNANLANTPTFSYEAPKDSRLEKQTWLEVSLPKTNSERLSPEILKAADCQSCKNEKRLKSEYDKILSQSKREKEALQQKINELEAELRKQEDVYKRTEEEHEDGTVSVEHPNKERLFSNCSTCGCDAEAYRRLEQHNRDKQEQIDCLLAEIEELNSQLDTIRHGERDQDLLFKSKQSQLVSDMEGVKLQLERVKEREKLRVSCLEREKVELLSQLEDVNTELEKLRKKRSLLVADLTKEKDCCTVEMERLKASSEKMKVENLALSDTIRTLQQELEKRSAMIGSPPYTPGAEVLLISHRASQEKGLAAATEYKFQEICSCGRTFQNINSPSNKSGMIQTEDDVMRESYRQMKRERNLLLDVMVIMYERRWFVDEAIPYVRRTLRKCGILSASPD